MHIAKRQNVGRVVP